MSTLKKARALTKKLESVIFKKSALEGLAQGIYYYKNPNNITETLKDERAIICESCDMIEFDDFEPIKDEDERISGKMCGECFCSLPYLLRQTKKGCELKKWK